MSAPAAAAAAPAPSRAAAAASSAEDVGGAQRAAPSISRRRGFLRRRKIRCPHGHTIETNARFREDGVLRCDKKNAPGAAECGALVYLLVFPALGGRLRLWAADVTARDLREMEARGLDVEGVLEYLGALGGFE